MVFEVLLKLTAEAYDEPVFGKMKENKNCNIAYNFKEDNPIPYSPQAMYSSRDNE